MANNSSVAIAHVSARARWWGRFLGALFVIGFLLLLLIIYGQAFLPQNAMPAFLAWLPAFLAQIRPVIVAPLMLWSLVAALVLLLLLALGFIANGRALGVLVDSRNRFSLSRFQILLWTLLAISAFTTIALLRNQPGALDAAANDCFVELEASAEAATPEQTVAAEAACAPQPLGIVFPAELLLALGISTASFAGSTLIKSNKQGQEPKLVLHDEEALSAARIARDQYVVDLALQTAELKTVKTSIESGGAVPDDNFVNIAAQPAGQERTLAVAAAVPAYAARIAEAKVSATMEAVARSERQVKKLEADIAERSERIGAIKVNETPAQARMAEIFLGDEVGNYDKVDLSKVQMFFFTLAPIVSYAIAVAGMLLDSSVLLAPSGVALPDFSASQNAVLLLSHSGYLGVKSIDHSNAPTG